MVVHVAFEACREDWREGLVFHDLESGETSVIWEPSGSSGTAWIKSWESDGTLVFVEQASPWSPGEHEQITRRIDARTGEPR